MEEFLVLFGNTNGVTSLECEISRDIGCSFSKSISKASSPAPLAYILSQTHPQSSASPYSQPIINISRFHPTIQTLPILQLPCSLEAQSSQLNPSPFPSLAISRLPHNATVRPVRTQKLSTPVTDIPRPLAAV
jgi:hypothetical protein